LDDQSVLLLLDNVEHVIDASPSFVALLIAAPGLKILATSRQPLRVFGERVWSVPPLRLPESDRQADLGLIAASPAVDLFVRCACAADPDFMLTDANARDVCAICRRLDGLPLALELAAVRVPALPPAALLARLDPALALLTGGARDAPTRQRALRDTVAWSYDLLGSDEQRLFRRLGVFAGGFALTAAEAVCESPDSAPPVSAGIAILVEHNLLRRDAGSDDDPRYAMLETVREFAVERLERSDDAAGVGARHARYFVELVKRAERDNYTSAEGVWFSRLDAELANLRAALAWASGHDAEILARLAGGLWWYWRTRGYWIEADTWLQRALATTEACERETELLVKVGDAAINLGDVARGEALIAEALTIARTLGDSKGLAEALMLLGQSATGHGGFGRAEAMLEESLALFQTLDEPAWTVGCGMSLGRVLHAEGENERALALLRDAASLGRTIGSAWGLVLSLVGLGQASLSRGDRQAARDALVEALAIATDYGDATVLGECFELAAEVALTEGDAGLGAILLGAADAQLTPIGVVRWPVQQRLVSRVSAAIEAALGAEHYASAHGQGQAMSTADAIAATKLAAGTGRYARPRDGRALSPREREVLRLLAEGKSDREIAAALSLSYRTVTSYVTSVLNKLGLGSRTAAAAHAIRHGLV
jgi:predicted ATPase/DNA-binding CsgD family transcriptional regulator